MNPYCLGVDVWEGSLDIDEPTLKAAGVEFIVIRLNDMNGYHHEDENFITQWQQAQAFVRWPYFVYSPWYSGKENFEWLMAHLPAGCNRVSVDIEVRRSGYGAIVYYANVMDFLWRLTDTLDYEVYTGYGYKDLLAAWPNVKYWWARYPFSFYPPATTRLSWELLKAKLDAEPWNPGTTPGQCKLWQISGDRYILPGTAERCIDVNVFNGNAEELKAYAGYLNPEDLTNTVYLPKVNR